MLVHEQRCNNFKQVFLSIFFSKLYGYIIIYIIFFLSFLRLRDLLDIKSFKTYVTKQENKFILYRSFITIKMTKILAVVLKNAMIHLLRFL